MSVHQKILEKSKLTEKVQPQTTQNIINQTQTFEKPLENHYEQNSLMQNYGQIINNSEEQNEEIQRMKPFVRMTTDILPNTKKLYSMLKIPIGAIIQPFAPDPYVKEFSNFKGQKIVRCEECKAYISPYANFIEEGSRWKCHLCLHTNEVSSSYYCPIDISTKKRNDANEKPELSSNVYEIQAPVEYSARPPISPVFFFVLDVSKDSIASGAFLFCVSIIKDMVEKDLLPGGERTMIGIITYDSAVHFYNTNPSLRQPQMVCVTDFENIALPLNEELLLNIADSKPSILNLLDSIPKYFANTENNGTAFYPAIIAAAKAIKNMGGRMIIFQFNDALVLEVIFSNSETIAIKDNRDRNKQQWNDKIKFFLQRFSFGVGKPFYFRFAFHFLQFLQSLYSIK